MPTSYYMNNGQIFTVADQNSYYSCYLYSQYTTCVGLAYESPPATWIDGMNYIVDDFIPLSDQGQDINNIIAALTSSATIDTHKLYLNYLDKAGQFIWGDYYNGGLYVFRDSSNTYGYVLFSGYGKLIADPTYDIFYYVAEGTAKNLPSSKMVFTITYNPISDRYIFNHSGDVIENGKSVSYRVKAEPRHANPLDLTQVTSVDYIIIPNTPTPLQSTLTDNNQYTVNPIGGTTYLSSSNAWLVHSDDIVGFENTDFIKISAGFGAVGWSYDPAYEQGGSWMGGDGNMAGDDPMGGGGTNPTGGGGGKPSQYSEPHGLPTDTQFNVNALTSGFFNIFHCSGTEMASFNQWLWQSFTENWWDALKKVLQDPLTFVIGAGMIRHTPSTDALKEITFNGIGTEVFAYPVTEHITKLDCGYQIIDEQFKTALDYGGYSDTKIFLPYIGIYSLDQNEVMNSKISLKYEIDNLTGACVATINIDKLNPIEQLDSVLYKFTGNCMYQLPVCSKDYQNAINAGINIATSIVGAASGSASPVGALGSVASNVMNLKPSVFRSGNLASNYGFMDSLEPYLIFERPYVATPDRFGEFRGYPSASMVKIKVCKGFFCVRNTDTMKLQNIHATNEEKRMIMELLRNGVYFQEQ